MLARRRAIEGGSGVSMPDIQRFIDELDQIATELATVAAEANDPALKQPANALGAAADDVGKAWSGSNIGYHARVYYKGYESPPPNEIFSREWGLMFGGGESGWQVLTDEDTRTEILRRAGDVDLQPLRDKATSALDKFQDKKEAVSSILGTYLTTHADSYVEDLKEKVDNTSVRGMRAYARANLPTGMIASRDSTAIDQGLAVAPHQQILAEIKGVLAPFKEAQALSGYAKNAADHLRRRPSDPPLATMQQAGSRVFVGHGGSPQWRELKDYVQDSCGVPVDEFNRVPVAGFTTVARLNDMLDSAGMAFLVMTAEDEMADGSRVARDNVIHEVGLFQGRLGFDKAIVMLEEGCEEFSNIHGLNQVRYPKGNISAKFHEVRALLEREKLV